MRDQVARRELGASAPTGALGVLGGMGPAATADFLRRLADVTPAQRDQDHVPVILYADPTTPDRSDAIEREGADPLPKLLDGIRFLDAAGVATIAIPCNSAHLWYDEMQAATSVPILHIVHTAMDRIAGMLRPGTAIGLLGTEGTLNSQLYQERLVAAGFRAIAPDTEALLASLMAGIRAVKAGQLAQGRDLLAEESSRLIDKGADAILLACTDISVALDGLQEIDGTPILDANTELARAATDRLIHRPRKRTQFRPAFFRMQPHNIGSKE